MSSTLENFPMGIPEFITLDSDWYVHLSARSKLKLNSIGRNIHRNFTVSQLDGILVATKKPSEKRLLTPRLNQFL